MIKFEKRTISGLTEAIRGMRNPMNSWEKSDTYQDKDGLHIGENDIELMRKLAANGSVHAKYRRMIVVYVDITAPLYWWKEYDTYKVGTVANSCSTMHKIHDKEFVLDDFSHEHLFNCSAMGNIPDHEEQDSLGVLKTVIRSLNYAREAFLETHDKNYWWQMIQLLPSSYNQKRTVMLNYEVLANIYRWRKDHKLDEWRGFCNWIEELPLQDLITGLDTLMECELQ